MEGCIFCKIVAGDIPSKRVYEDEHCIAFHDLHPQAPVHVLIIPKRHASGLNALDALPDVALAACLRAAEKVAQLTGIGNTGYRVLTNVGEHGCQSVHHLHFHVLGGRQLPDRMA
ncbi:MAG: histidine triad nucleotide-binding protein [Christensenellales bacterium]|jgi:histidine triad (HIT) family protein